MPKKGERFTAHSPLSLREKEFLAQFNGGSGERVLNDEYLSSDQIAAFDLARLGDANRNSPAKQRLVNQWTHQLGVRIHKGVKGGWWKLAGGVSPKGTYGRSPPEGWPARLPAWDHGSLWARDAEILLAVSQPYPWKLIDDLGEINEFAESFGLNFKISNFPSWYFPGCCWFIEWYSSLGPRDIVEHYDPVRMVR